MSKLDIAMIIYIIFMIVATFVSFKYGSTMIKKKGLFLPSTLIAGTINLVLGVFAILVWVFFTWGVNEFLFFGGLVLGSGLLVVGEAVLLTTLFLKRKKWIHIYNETFN
ncbi:MULTISPECIES: hypothetical protein [Pontibacillus]|uniref:YesK-like protein n=1 Tax=Pontibacillus chungwhensis TaxID=265426 RepID=A0ABY8V3Y6_9BACI|nr:MULTISPECIES: hypothetical protein [Pontibacillus]MCD5324395.1 hypothetical protein [Pontibacillus sp. HN14]WIF99309.1 hypothetical protein QNI29_06520 [Pontibacillus chungwhensis]